MSHFSFHPRGSFVKIFFPEILDKTEYSINKTTLYPVWKYERSLISSYNTSCIHLHVHCYTALSLTCFSLMTVANEKFSIGLSVLSSLPWRRVFDVLECGGGFGESLVGGGA